MDVVLTVQDKSKKIFVYQTFDDKEFFIKAVETAYARRDEEGRIGDHDKIVALFAKGGTIKKADFALLRRALRHYDEVYLCNELHSALEELPSNVELLTLEKIDTPLDLGCYKV